MFRSPGTKRATMETVSFGDVEVLGACGADLECRIEARSVLVPRLLIQPGSEVRRPGDRGNLVIHRWLAIGLGLVSPFAPPALPLRHAAAPVQRRAKEAG